MKLKAIIFTIIGLVSSNLIKAQNIQFGLAPEISFPTANASSVSAIGFGASIKAEIGLSAQYALTATSGYHTFVGRKYLGVRTQNLEAIPAKLGFKYYSTPEFYLEAQAGAAFYSNDNATTSFIWSPGIGTYIKTGSHNKIDFSIRYEAWTRSRVSSVANVNATTFGFIGLRVGYNFNL